MDRGLEALRLPNTGYAAQLAEMPGLAPGRGRRAGAAGMAGWFPNRRAS